jgi:ATP-dependent RNA helicase RhlE
MAITLVSPDEIEQLHDLQKVLGSKIKEVIVPEYAPKEVKSRGYLLPPPQRRRKAPAKKSAPSAGMSKKGKKRKTTKRDGWKLFDAEKERKRGRK